MRIIRLRLDIPMRKTHLDRCCRRNRLFPLWVHLNLSIIFPSGISADSHAIQICYFKEEI